MFSTSVFLQKQWFFEKNMMSFWKSLEVAVLLSNDTERLKKLKIFKIFLFWKRIAAFYEKKVETF